MVRNVWAYAIIFCGHFPDQTYTFSQEEVEDESRGAWYVRQLVGAANIEGSPLFHVASGNLGYQVEHHLFPDMPSTRYAEIAPRIKEICERYELPYNGGPFGQQLGMVQRTILRLAFPGGKPRPKPGPYKGGDADDVAATERQPQAADGRERLRARSSRTRACASRCLTGRRCNAHDTGGTRRRIASRACGRERGTWPIASATSSLRPPRPPGSH